MQDANGGSGKENPENLYSDWDENLLAYHSVANLHRSGSHQYFPLHTRIYVRKKIIFHNLSWSVKFNCSTVESAEYTTWFARWHQTDQDECVL